MGDILKDAFGEWYTLCCAAGVALAVAALAASHQQLLIISLGLVFLRIGEFFNHPFISTIAPHPFALGTVEISGRPRRNKPFGLLLGALGCGLIGIGLYRLLWA